MKERPDRRKGKTTSLYDLTPNELEGFFLSIGEKPYRAKQVLDFLYRNPRDSITEFTTLSAELRERLDKTVALYTLRHIASLESSDSAVRLAYETRNGEGKRCVVESVWMPYDRADAGKIGSGGKPAGGGPTSDRHTLCISSQAGCSAGCVFCATGAMGLKRQLTTGEIMCQFVDAWRRFGSKPDAVLFMGMGEPMHNYDSVCAAVELMTHKQALGYSPGRLVVSTAGELERLGAFHARFPGVKMAISLNAATDDVRDRLMPVNRKFNLASISAFVQSIDPAPRDKITFEYVLLSGVNDTPVQEAALMRFLKPLADRIKVNLIPYNPVKGKNFRAPERDRLYSIQKSIRKLGINVFIRRNRGRGVGGACGQLAGRI